MQTHQFSTSTTSPVLYTTLGNPLTRRCYVGLSLRLAQFINSSPPKSRKIRFLRLSTCKIRSFSKKRSSSGGGWQKYWILMGEEGKGRSMVARSAFGSNDGGGGGGGNWNNSNNRRVLGNLALAIALTYLSTTGQLGWLLDAVVSIWLLFLILPFLGLGAFLLFASRDMVQDSCPNCGNEFQILKSSLNDGVQLCPFCTQPFSVQNNRFVRASTKFSSDRSSPFDQVFNGFQSSSDKEKPSSTLVVDIEAEVKDID